MVKRTAGSSKGSKSKIVAKYKEGGGVGGIAGGYGVDGSGNRGNGGFGGGNSASQGGGGMGGGGKGGVSGTGVRSGTTSGTTMKSSSMSNMPARARPTSAPPPKPMAAKPKAPMPTPKPAVTAAKPKKQFSSYVPGGWGSVALPGRKGNRDWGKDQSQVPEYKSGSTKAGSIKTSSGSGTYGGYDGNNNDRTDPMGNRYSKGGSVLGKKKR